MEPFTPNSERFAAQRMFFTWEHTVIVSVQMHSEPPSGRGTPLVTEHPARSSPEHRPAAARGKAAGQRARRAPCYWNTPVVCPAGTGRATDLELYSNVAQELAFMQGRKIKLQVQFPSLFLPCRNFPSHSSLACSNTSSTETRRFVLIYFLPEDSFPGYFPRAWSHYVTVCSWNWCLPSPHQHRSGNTRIRP